MTQTRSRREAIKLALGAVAAHSQLISAGAGAAMALTGCGSGSGTSGGGVSVAPPVSTPSASITISASTSTPTALTPVVLNVVGLDFTMPFKVQLINSSGYSSVLSPVRTSAANGVVVVAAPIYIDPTTGSTAPLTASVQITQGTLTSNALVWNIADLPSTASYGVNPGDISRGFFNAQSIYFGLTVNALQAMRALPTSKTDTTTVQAHLTSQQLNTIEARANVDLIVTGSQPSLSVGTANDGSPIIYDAHSVDIQDRIIGMYLQSIGYLPSTLYPAIPALAVKPYVHNKKHKGPVRDVALTPAAIINGLSYVGGAIGLTNSAIQYNTATNSTDSSIAFGQGVATAALVLGTLAGAPELVAAATIVGTGYALAGLVNDGYKWYTASNAVTAATDSGNAQALATAEKQLSDAQANVAVDSVGAVLGVFGFPAAVANDVGLGAQVVTAMTTAQEGLSGVAVQGLSLLTSAVGLAVTANGLEMSADAQSTQASNLEVPASSTSFGLVDGMVLVSNANGPVLSPLSGAYLTEPNTGTAFSTLAGLDDNYSLIVPLGVPGFNYAQMSLEPYDPVSFTATGAAVTIDLSTLTALTPANEAPITGTCTDTDAGDPDQDDPDCD
jgi:hypothetical protein